MISHISAIALAKAVRDQNILWFEEPIIPENFAGYAEISKASGIAVAQGENSIGLLIC